MTQSGTWVARFAVKHSTNIVIKAGLYKSCLPYYTLFSTWLHTPPQPKNSSQILTYEHSTSLIFCVHSTSYIYILHPAGYLHWAPICNQKNISALTQSGTWVARFAVKHSTNIAIKAGLYSEDVQVLFTLLHTILYLATFV